MHHWRDLFWVVLPPHGGQWGVGLGWLVISHVLVFIAGIIVGNFAATFGQGPKK